MQPEKNLISETKRGQVYQEYLNCEFILSEASLQFGQPILGTYTSKFREVWDL